MTMQRIWLAGAAVATLALAAAGAASAGTTTYVGQDDGAPIGGPFTNSSAAQTAFFAGASGPMVTENFDSQPVGDTGSLSIAGGASLTYTGPAFGNGFSGVSSTTFGNLYGFDVSDGGAGQWLGFPNGSATFTFAGPSNAFGFWLTGVQTVFTASITVDFNDGASQSFAAPINVNGGAAFFGVTDTASFASVTINSDTGNDAWGIDSVSYNGSAGVPEPASWALMIAGFGLAGAALRQRRTAAAAV